MRKKVSLLSRIGLVSAVAAMVLLVFSFETAQAQEINTGDNGATLEEMQDTINELTELLQQMLQNQNNPAQAEVLPGTVNLPGIPQISGQLAREIALELIGHGTARDVLLFEENGVLIFEVEIRHSNVRYMVYVNATNGTVVRMSRHEDGYQGITTLPEVVPPIVLPPVPQPPAGGIHTTARLNEAGAAAIRENGGRGLVRHICISRERRVDVYHVRLYDNGNRVDIYLNRNDLSVERTRSRQHSNASSTSRSFQRRQMNITPTLSFNQAADAALAYFDGGTIREVSRGFIGGRNNVTAVFDVDITTTGGERRSVYVDLHTGEILEHRRG